MAEYRLYCLDDRGRIARRHDIEAPDDSAAVEAARAHDSPADCELWSGPRKVALLSKRGEPTIIKRSA